MENNDWKCCPASVGSFESSCHTWQGNELALFLETSKGLVEKKNHIHSTTFKYFSGKRGENLFPKEGLPKTHVYNILNAGLYVPTYMSNFTYKKAEHLFQNVLEAYEKEVGEKLEIDKNTFADFHNYILRDLNDWLNDNKRY